VKMTRLKSLEDLDGFGGMSQKDAIRQQRAIIARLIKIREEMPIDTVEYELTNKLINELVGKGVKA